MQKFKCICDFLVTILLLRNDVWIALTGAFIKEF